MSLETKLKSLNRSKLEELFYLKREQSIRTMRTSFWDYCKMRAPDFYKESRPHLKDLCNIFQGFYFGGIINPHTGTPYTKMMWNLPPRLGKTRTLVNGCAWILGINPKERILSCSYNGDEATDFSKYTRNAIMEEKVYPDDIVHSDVFPNCKISHNDGSYGKWALEGEFFSYKGAGVGGGVTGKGATWAIIDDLLKSAEDAFSDIAKKQVWEWYTGTFLSRMEEGSRLIINMARWATDDPCGMIFANEDEKNNWLVVKMEAIDEEGNMLCPELLSKKSYYDKMKNMHPMIFRANYHQKPVDIEGRLYKRFNTYTNESLPKDFDTIIAYGDTADEGNDYLAIGIVGVLKNRIYMLDILYTQRGMEFTEIETARLLDQWKVDKVRIESNSGGRSFARAVRDKLLDVHNNSNVDVTWFHQTRNKMGRIKTASNYVMNYLYFPEDWNRRFPAYCESMTNFQANGKNKHDDAQDMTTGLVEMARSKRKSEINYVPGVY